MKDGSSLHLRVNVVPKITGTLQRACFDTKRIGHPLKDIPLADTIPTAKETAQIKLLLGSDYYCDIFSAEILMKQVFPELNLMQRACNSAKNPSAECVENIKLVRTRCHSVRRTHHQE